MGTGLAIAGIVVGGIVLVYIIGAGLAYYVFKQMFGGWF